MPSELYLIDAIGPFFKGYDRARINWSKIPWRRFQKMTPEKREKRFLEIAKDLKTFVEHAAETGYTAVTLDDVVHLAEHEYYETETSDLIAEYRGLFRPLFATCKEAGMDLYLTMDIMSWTPALVEKIGEKEEDINEFLSQLIEQFLIDFPEVAGVIIRIGESDGLDVKDDFRSALQLKDPEMVNRFLKKLLPVFEKHDRTCVFRTWTVGAHHVGDLIWRDSTLEKSLEGITSDHIVLSMKYGESDFFRYLKLNRNFFVTDLPKIVELQSRREYEGAGEYPSFIGYDYEHIATDLREATNVIGMSVWCNTGGWHPFRRLTWIEPEGIWTEINTHVSLRLFRYGDSVEEAVRTLPQCTPETTAAWIELMRLSHEVIVDLLYVPDFASQSLYFRRVRIPTLLGVYWHNIFINHSMKKFLGHFVRDGEACIRQGYSAIGKIDRMHDLAATCNLPVEDIEYMKHTFAILALAREYFFRPFDEDIVRRLKKAKKAYKKRYPRGTRYRYAIKLDFKKFRMKRRTIKWMFHYFIRDQKTYRAIDRLVFLRFLSVVYVVVRRAAPRVIPEFARKSAMGIDAIFR